jgi:eukaryotic-like serine/threonine-protein kinase
MAKMGMVWAQDTQLQGGKYTIDRVLRQGRLSTTYLASSRKGARVVIKATNDEAIDPEDFKALKARFSSEAVRLALCSSPYIVQVEDTFEEDDLACIVMEYVAGVILADRNPSKLTESEALRYIRQIGVALQVLHDRELLHRDVTPENIMLRSRNGVNEAVLIDFGLVRDWSLSRSMTMMANDITAFTAPELCDPGEKRGAFTDLYGLGAVLYALVTGNLPPKATSPQRKLGQPLPFPAGVHPEIARSIEAAMAFEPIDRPKTVTAWLAMLPEIIPEVSDPPVPDPPVPDKKEKQEEKRQRWFENLGLVCLILGTMFAGFQGVMAIVSYVYPKDSR